MKKQCGSCRESKPLADFHRRGKQGHQTWCKQCRREYDATYHSKTRRIRLAQKKRTHQDFRAWYIGLKSGTPYVDCGERFHHAAMVWDHLPGHDKLDDLGSLVGRDSKRRILEEIAKCELVCANCHAVRTYNRLRGVAQPG